MLHLVITQHNSGTSTAVIEGKAFIEVQHLSGELSCFEEVGVPVFFVRGQAIDGELIQYRCDWLIHLTSVLSWFGGIFCNLLLPYVGAVVDAVTFQTSRFATFRIP